MAISENDKKIVRDLAKRLAEAATRPEEKKKAEAWRRHNNLERVKPMVLIFPEGAWREVLTDKDLVTEDGFCRGHEYM
ncbi:hypothetical protein CO111_00415, partial [Candidatus Desantisbacteria bacterium CG_4_9_14_3_um_filter_50_7]